MNERIKEATRSQIAAFLPVAIARALSSYRNFSGKIPRNDSREFAAHHSACKVAIAHIELLLKLARWAEISESQVPDDLAVMLAQAEDELRRYHDGEGG